MSKKMTPCEKLGYKVGDKFKVVDGTGVHYAVGSFITLIHDDGSSCPRFNGVHSIFESGDSFFPLDFVEKVAKLKPAKQALADAIHQNGGWRSGANWVCQHGLNRMVVFSASGMAPTRNAARGMACWNSGAIFFGGFQFDRKLPNWHQCVLSRDEYFTAYPEQVKVEICNETKHKVEVEMESESEVTIKVSDWHKNGELPPVGEVCLWIGRKENGDYRADLRTGDRVEVIAHYKPRSDGPMVAVFAYESRESIGRQTDQSIAKCFRPLRTEREKAIDEMVCEFIDHHGDPKGGERYLGIAAKLYDAGYRKEVK